VAEREQIQQAQRAWAERHGVAVDDWGRVETIEANLFRRMNPETRREYEEAGEKELEVGMRSLHSPAALVCNLFDPWRGRPLRALATACGADPALTKLCFQATFPTGLRGAPPHLDVLLEEGGTPTAIESAFTEIYTTGKHSSFAESYIAQRELWEGWPRVRELAQSIASGRTDFTPLDPAQLVKHALGLRRKLGDEGYRLLYLWYDAQGPLAAAHREALERFSAAVEGEIPFAAMTHQALFERLRASGEADPDHLAYLEDRYFGPRDPASA